MKHKHHIIPKHAGGTDDPSNLIELTVEEHAEAHKLLWEEQGRYQDYYAWQGLAGLIGKEDILKGIMNQESIKNHLSKKGKEFWNNLTEEEKTIKKNQFLKVRKLTNGSKGKTLKLSEETKNKHKKPKSKEHRLNIKKSMIGTRTGQKNPSFGSIWINNNTDSKKIKNGDTIPTGWFLGRAFKPRMKRKIGT